MHQQKLFKNNFTVWFTSSIALRLVLSGYCHIQHYYYNITNNIAVLNCNKLQRERAMTSICRDITILYVCTRISNPSSLSTIYVLIIGGFRGVSEVLETPYQMNIPFNAFSTCIFESLCMYRQLKYQ